MHFHKQKFLIIKFVKHSEKKWFLDNFKQEVYYHLKQTNCVVINNYDQNVYSKWSLR